MLYRYRLTTNILKQRKGYLTQAMNSNGRVLTGKQHV